MATQLLLLRSGRRSLRTLTSIDGSAGFPEKGLSFMTLPSPNNKGPNEHCEAARNYRHNYIPGGVNGAEVHSRRGMLVLLFFVFAFLAMGQIRFGFVVHVVS